MSESLITPGEIMHPAIVQITTLPREDKLFHLPIQHGEITGILNYRILCIQYKDGTSLCYEPTKTKGRISFEDKEGCTVLVERGSREHMDVMFEKFCSRKSIYNS
jgi:hypothetical protein